MLHLKSSTSARWLRQVDSRLDEILIDHALCETKAAATAMTLIMSYVEEEQVATELSPIVTEELEHFQMVLDVLKNRNIPFRRLKPGGYGRKLHDLARNQEKGRAVDRLLIAGIIEARSCERFAVLRDHLAEREPELAAFFGGLFESEARHHATYVRLAKLFAPDEEVMRRLDELTTAEAEILAVGDPLPRVHS
jgi:tRNA-(ms[2]io[6]A)-hydroxylase